MRQGIVISVNTRYRIDREKRMQREKKDAEWIAWQDRFIQTYEKLLGKPLEGPVIDIGCGTNHLAKAFIARGIPAEGIDVDQADFEKDALPYPDNSFQTAILHAVIEHLMKPDLLMRELSRVLKPNGLIIVRTTNWRMDFRNFYRDPTHVKPYVPEGLQTLLSMHGFRVFFVGPALVCKPMFLWRLPKGLQWHVAKWMRGGTRSMLLLGTNRKEL